MSASPTCKLGYVDSYKSYAILFYYFRAVDPDPDGSAFILPPGSGSRRETFSNKNRKNARKLVKSASLFNFLKVNLHQLHCFLLLNKI